MRLLLDTHVFLYWVLGDPRLSPLAEASIKDSGTQVYLSAASVWEMAIKLSLGRLRLEGDLLGFVEGELRQNGFQALPVTYRHASRVATLPPLHRDPFDRLLVAQALEENLTLVSGDAEIARYPVELLW